MRRILVCAVLILVTLPCFAQKLLPWQRMVDVAVPGQTKSLESLFDLSWRANANACTLSVSPNPILGRGVLTFNLPSRGEVALRVYDVAGREAATLVRGARESGVHQVVLDASRLGNGIYLVRLEAGGRSAVRKVLVIH